MIHRFAYIGVFLLVAAACSLSTPGSGVRLILEVPEFFEASILAKGDASHTSRTLTPSAARAVIALSGSGYSDTREYALASGQNVIELAGVPIALGLSIEASVYDAFGVKLCAGSGSIGTGDIRVVLAPDLTGATTVPFASVGSMVASISLDAGRTSFYRIEMNPTVPGEYCFAIDNARYQPWMKAYDTAGNPFPTIAETASEGWAVIDVPAGPTTVIFAVVGSAIDSSNLAMFAYDAIFVDTDVGDNVNGGGSDDPYKTIAYALSQASSTKAVFIRGSAPSPQVGISGGAPFRLRMHGGFGATDWGSRDPIGAPSAIRGSGAQTGAVLIGDFLSGGFFSGLDIGFDPITSGSIDRDTVRASLSLASMPCIFASCTIRGPGAPGGGTQTNNSSAIRWGANAPLVIVNSRVEGGVTDNSQTSGNNVADGIRVEQNAETLIRNSIVSGGNAITDFGAGAISRGVAYLGTTGTLKIVSSTVIGGPSSTYQAQSYGLYTMTGTKAVNSIFAGGAVDGTSSEYAYGVMATAIFRSYGCTIVSGDGAHDATATSVAFGSSLADLSPSLLAETVLVAASVGDANSHCAYVNGSNLPFFEVFSVFAPGADPWWLTSGTAFSPISIAGSRSDFLQVANPGSCFVASTPGAYPLADWLAANDLRPAAGVSGFASSISPATSPAVFASIAYDSLLAEMPEVALYRDGSARGAAISRGAYPN